MTGEPLPQCQFRSSRPTRATARLRVRQPRFFDCTDAGPEGIRAFDLRNALT